MTSDARRWRTPPPLPVTYPRDRTPPFLVVGRRQVVTRIAAHLERWEERVRPVVLTGPAGIGKTEIAARYLADHRDAYERLAWVDATTPATAATDLTALAHQFGLQPGDADDGQALADAMIDQLLQDGRWWLLVVDNLDCPDTVNTLAPVFQAGPRNLRVLVTARKIDPWRQAVPIAISALEPAAAAEFLLQRTPPDPADAERADHAEALAAELESLPWALALAGAYVDRTGISLRACLQLVRDARTTGQRHDLHDLLALTEVPQAAPLDPDH